MIYDTFLIGQFLLAGTKDQYQERYY